MEKIKVCKTLLWILYLIPAISSAVKDHEKWWIYNLTNAQILIEFERWLGPIDAPSRKFIREIVRDNKYKTVCDIPCGLGIDYHGFKKDNISATYTGIDNSPVLVDLLHKKNIPVFLGDIEDIAYPDNSFECVFCRHILEHLTYYEIALSNVIRVAHKEAIIVFFIAPTDGPDKINRADERGYPIYHNHYNKEKLEKYVFSNANVQGIEWVIINETNELALRIKKGIKA